MVLRGSGSAITPLRCSLSSATGHSTSWGRPRQHFPPSQPATCRASAALVSSASRATTPRIRSNTSSENSCPHTRMYPIVPETSSSVQPLSYGTCSSPWTRRGDRKASPIKNRNATFGALPTHAILAPVRPLHAAGSQFSALFDLRKSKIILALGLNVLNPKLVTILESVPVPGRQRDPSCWQCC